MNKLFLGLLTLVLMGAGCSAGVADDASQEDAQAEWWLSFDLPEDWVVVSHYGGGSGELPTADLIEARTTDVVIQSTSLPISVDGGVGEGWEEYVDSDYTYVRAFRYSKLRPLSDDAIDLGNGFYEADWLGETAYWWPQEFGNYLFLIDVDGQEREAAKEVIFTAQEHDLSDQL